MSLLDSKADALGEIDGGLLSVVGVRHAQLEFAQCLRRGRSFSSHQARQRLLGLLQGSICALLDLVDELVENPSHMVDIVTQAGGWLSRQPQPWQWRWHHR